MYAKTEIYYLMKDKVIPSLLNSEKKIKLEDIKEVFEKSSYWKKRNFNNMKNKYYSPNNKNNKFPLKKKQDKKSPNKNINIIDILKINNNPKNSRNHPDNNLFRLGDSKYCYNYSSLRTSVTFCNPLLKSLSNHFYKLTQTTSDNSSPMRTERYIMNNKSIKNRINKATSVSKSKNNIFLLNYNNNLLKNKKPNYEYKTFYYLDKNKMKRLKFGDLRTKKEEENNHLILRGLAMNKKQKEIYSKCRFLNLINGNDNKINSNNNIEKTIKTKENINTNTNTSRKKNYKKIKIKPKNLNLNLNINVSYSLKGLLNFNYPIKIQSSKYNFVKQMK